MNHLEQLENLLLNLGSSCEDIAQLAYNAARFGMDAVQPGQALPNEQLLWQAMNYVTAYGEMMVSLTGREGLSREAIDTTKAEMEDYFLGPYEWREKWRELSGE